MNEKGVREQSRIRFVKRFPTPFLSPGNISVIAVPSHCSLSAGFVAKVKDFELYFDGPNNTEQAWIQPKFRDLTPGRYVLRCTWADAHPSVSGATDWTGELTAPEFEFTLEPVEADSANALRVL